MPHFDGDLKVYNLGERGSGLRVPGQVQDFETLRQECLRKKTLYEDPEFQAVDSSMYYSKPPPEGVKWLRPMEMGVIPKLVVDESTRFDIKQGRSSDCWFLSAIAVLAQHKSLLNRVVPLDQDFDENYAGIFHFRFWQYGRWVEVVIDDRLPTKDGKLLFLSSSDPTEFWSALLEKAYAKLYGSYEALEIGHSNEALSDFTGGLYEQFMLYPKDFFDILLAAYTRGSLICCGVDSNDDDFEAITKEGLTKGHAYSITEVQLLELKDGTTVQMLRVRNPWGNETEWKGAWSDGSSEWDNVDDAKKESLTVKAAADGEFWMAYSDFETRFSIVEICNLTPDALTEQDGDFKKWETAMVEGEWVRDITAGGCINRTSEFVKNPQYLLHVEGKEDDQPCNVVIALMQKWRRTLKHLGKHELNINALIFELDEKANTKPLSEDYLSNHSMIGKLSRMYNNTREVTGRMTLKPGKYIIVPTTFMPGQEGHFMLRVFSETPVSLSEYDLDTRASISQMDSTVYHPTGTNVRSYTINIKSDTKVEEKVYEYDFDESQMHEFFRRVAQNEFAGWRELQTLLSEDPATGEELNLSKETCRSLMAMMDVDRSGLLDFQEFKALWLDMCFWRVVFRLQAGDRSMLNAEELQHALTSAGLPLSKRVVGLLVHRYSTRKGQVDFDDFVACAVKTRYMIDAFREHDSEEEERASLTLEEWLEATMYT